MSDIKPRAWAVKLDDTREASTIAIGNMDGTWWVDWERLHVLREDSKCEFQNASWVATRMICDLLLMARGHGLQEVSMERADEIALAYGALL